MTTSAERLGDWDDDQLMAVADPVHRYVSARLSDRHSVEDLVQETLARLLAARDRLDGSSLLPYGIVTARNLVAEHGRDLDRHRRHAHRTVDLREPDRPEDTVLRKEERAALLTALDALPTADRRLLLAHEVDGQDTASLAAASGGSAGGVAARLARARARLRVGYVLALRRADLPTVRCRPVLLSLSAGDRRRQRSLQAGRHLLACDTCASASGPLLERKRVLAGLAPWIWAPALAEVVWRRARTHTAQVATAGVVAAAVAGAAVAAARHSPAPAKAVAPPTSSPSPSASPSPADRSAPARPCPTPRWSARPYARTASSFSACPPTRASGSAAMSGTGCGCSCARARSPASRSGRASGCRSPGRWCAPPRRSRGQRGSAPRREQLG